MKIYNQQFCHRCGKNLICPNCEMELSNTDIVRTINNIEQYWHIHHKKALIEKRRTN
jgi:hypothetical protein